MEKVNYFLVLEKRLGDYNIIDINKLDICNKYVGTDLAMIDAFTSLYTENELKDSITRSNMASPNYLDGRLRIISDVKHNFGVLSKEKFNLIVEFQNSIEEIEGILKNKLYGMYKKVVESLFEDKGFIKGMLDRFNMALKENKKETVFKIIEELPYHKGRLIYFTVYEEKVKIKKENLRKLEKLNDVA